MSIGGCPRMKPSNPVQERGLHYLDDVACHWCAVFVDRVHHQCSAPPYLAACFEINKAIVVLVIFYADSVIVNHIQILFAVEADIHPRCAVVPPDRPVRKPRGKSFERRLKSKDETPDRPVSYPRNLTPPRKKTDSDVRVSSPDSSTPTEMISSSRDSKLAVTSSSRPLIDDSTYRVKKAKKITKDFEDQAKIISRSKQVCF